MSWQCIASGANGLVYYSFSAIQKEAHGLPFAKAWADVCKVGEEVRRYIPVLLSVEPAPTVSGAPAAWGVRTWRKDGATWLLVVNAQEKADAAELTLSEEFSVVTAEFGHWQREILHDNVKCIAVCASDGDRVYAIGPRQWGWCANCLNVSRDGGDTWSRPAMRGLPDMAEKDGARMSTVSVRPENPDEIYVVVSGPCGPGGGGVYASGNAGEDFRWIGEGLLPVDLFADVIWFGGAEIACGRGGGLVAASSKTGRVFARPAGATEWTEVTGLPGKAGSVVADALCPGRFYAFGPELGVFRTDDGGITWWHRHDAPVNGVCADLTKSGRVACNSDEGIEWSGDAGDTWRRIPGRPPRTGARLVFAGSRILVSSGGSGVFRSPPIDFANETTLIGYSINKGNTATNHAFHR